MIIFDKELQAEMDLERKMDDARDIELEQLRTREHSGRVEFYTKHEIWDNRLHGGMNRTETYDHYEGKVN